MLINFIFMFIFGFAWFGMRAPIKLHSMLSQAIAVWGLMQVSKFVEAQTKEISTRKHMHVCIILFVCERPHMAIFTHRPSFKDPHPSAMLVYFFQPPFPIFLVDVINVWPLENLTNGIIFRKSRKKLATSIYLSKVHNRNTKAIYEIRSKLSWNYALFFKQR